MDLLHHSLEKCPGEYLRLKRELQLVPDCWILGGDCEELLNSSWNTLNPIEYVQILPNIVHKVCYLTETTDLSLCQQVLGQCQARECFLKSWEGLLQLAVDEFTVLVSASRQELVEALLEAEEVKTIFVTVDKDCSVFENSKVRGKIVNLYKNHFVSEWPEEMRKLVAGLPVVKRLTDQPSKDSGTVGFVLAKVVYLLLAHRILVRLRGAPHFKSLEP
jgi:hypothetical protein